LVEPPVGIWLERRIPSSKTILFRYNKILLR